MKLRNIVKYQQLLNSLNDNTLRKSINTQLSEFINDLHTNQIDFDDVKNKITGTQLEVLKNLEQMSDYLNTLRNSVNKLVDDLAIPYYKKSENIYTNTLSMIGVAGGLQLRTKDIANNDESKEALIGAIQSYVSNEYACCQLAPGYGEITKFLVAGTPLYIVDDDHNTLRQFRENFFNDIMQRRTNFYTMSDTDDHPLYKLPQGQIGFCVIIDYFNFKTVEVIKKYLQSMYKIMRPGGVVIFNFNNCDYPKGIDKVDEMLYCYTTGTEMNTICTQVGFEVIKLIARDYDERENGISWLEIKKPGNLSTIRAAQGLAEIKNL